MFSRVGSRLTCVKGANGFLPFSSAAGGDGKAGAIREAGGAFSNMEAAREKDYFYKQQREQLKQLKANQISEQDYHKNQIEEHEKEIQRHKEALAAKK